MGEGRRPQDLDARFLPFLAIAITLGDNDSQVAVGVQIREHGVLRIWGGGDGARLPTLKRRPGPRIDHHLDRLIDLESAHQIRAAIAVRVAELQPVLAARGIVDRVRVPLAVLWGEAPGSSRRDP